MSQPASPENPEWLFLLEGDFAVAERYRVEAEGQDSTCVRGVHGAMISSLDAFMCALMHAFQFPFYARSNWNSFLECLQQLPDELSAMRYLIVISEADRLWCDSEEKWMREMLDMLASTSRWYATHRRSDWPAKIEFQVVAQVSNREADFVRRMRELGLVPRWIPQETRDK